MSTGTQEPGALSDLDLRIAGMSCAACQAHVQRALAAVPGVHEATVDLLANTAHVTAEPSVVPADLTSAVRSAGYDVVAAKPVRDDAGISESVTDSETDKPTEDGERSLGVRALLALLAGAVSMVLSMPLMCSGVEGGSDAISRAMMRLVMPLYPAWLLGASPSLLRWVLFTLALGTMIFAAPEIYRAAWRAARHRATNMNTLVALGTLIAFAASTYATVGFSIGKASPNFSDVYFEAVVFILAFLLAGRWLEGRARHRATSSLRAFAHTETGNARWIAEGAPAELDTHPEALLSAAETLLPLDAVAVGDILRVLPGDRVPLDGIVLAGRSSVEESMLTGEPLPATRVAGDKLFSGTLNLDGPLLVRATALGADSMQAQMSRLLARARSTRAPLQRLADQVSGVFVPTVLALAAVTFVIWAIADNTAGHHLGYGRALSLAIAVLVVACPCAMGLAVPAAIAVSLGTAARAGILIKGGEAMERLATVDMIAFDKTGTLTEGKPRILHFLPAAEAQYDTQTLLGWAQAVERFSTHPLAKALCDFVAATKLPELHFVVTDAAVLPGLGVRARVDGHEVAIGSENLVQTHEESLVDGALGATRMFMAVDGVHQMTFYAGDQLRPSAEPAMNELKALLLCPALLTGDVEASAMLIGHRLGIENLRARLLPAEKLDAISAFRREGHRVAMAGDGLNDAAALAHADVGIAMASGTDLAREAGHVLLLHHDLRLIPQAIRLARRTRRLMRQNLAWALLYNVLGIPLAAGVFLPHFGLALRPAFASAAMALSSVSVLLNSLRLARPLR